MIRISNLSKSYGENVVFTDFNLTAEEGRTTCVLGESGCGKTTLLNAVAGLTEYGGEITPVKAAYIFQTPRLVPNLTVIKNLTLIGADQERAAHMLAETGLAGRENDYPNALSGGEKQRVSLCRALLYPSDILLMDEPFSSLDLKTKQSVMGLYLRLMEAQPKTSIFVTHDVDEAVYLADEIAVIKGGEVAARFKNTKGGAFGANSPLREKLIEELLK